MLEFNNIQVQSTVGTLGAEYRAQSKYFCDELVPAALRTNTFRNKYQAESKYFCEESVSKALSTKFYNQG